MHDRLRTVLAEVFEVQPDEVPDDASIETMAGWDSLRQLELMLALELEYGVRLSAEDMLDLQSAEAIEAFLEQSGVG
jgi:acyl carrier protein